MRAGTNNNNTNINRAATARPQASPPRPRAGAFFIEGSSRAAAEPPKKGKAEIRAAKRTACFTTRQRGRDTGTETLRGLAWAFVFAFLRALREPGACRIQRRSAAQQPAWARFSALLR